MMTTPRVDHDWLLIGEAARLLGISPSRVRVLADTGRVRAKRTSFGTRLIYRPSIVKYARERERWRSRRQIAPLVPISPGP